ncbi:SGNH/GDSL hydrolase family protein [bacterium]|nr:SGNH/GDSL hydrolase family protein [bacterium]
MGAKPRLATPPPRRSWSLRRSLVRLYRKTRAVILAIAVTILGAHFASYLVLPDLHDLLELDDVLRYRVRALTRVYDFHYLPKDHRVLSYVTGPYGERIADSGTPREYAPPYIICVGDSVTFGMGVNGDETYAYRLGQRLAGRANVLNFGVLGYTGYQSSMMAEDMAGRFDAALVIFQINANDDDPVVALNPLYEDNLVANTRLGRIALFFLWVKEIGDRHQTRVPDSLASVRNLLHVLEKRDTPILFTFKAIVDRQYRESLPPSLLNGELQKLRESSNARSSAFPIRYFKSHVLRSSHHLNPEGHEKLAADLERVILRDFPDVLKN